MLTGPFVRTFFRVRALRHLVGPRLTGPFIRDPILALECKDRDGWRCTACGRGGYVEADHTRPLWTGGADHLDNLRTLCLRPGRPSCHGAKTGAERKVRDARSQGRRGILLPGGSGLLAALRLMRPRWWIATCLFVLGALWGEWWWCAALGLAAGMFAPPFLRSLLPSFLRRPRGPGLDGRSTFDDQQEARRGGMLGDWQKAGHTFREGGLTIRYGLIGVSGFYFAGYLFPLIAPRLVGVIV